MKHSRALTLVPVMMLLLCGCTGANPDLPPDSDAADMSLESAPDGSIDLAGSDPQAAIAEQCTKLSAAACERLGQCSQYLLRYYYGDATACKQRVELTCSPYVTLPGSSWSLDRLRACTAGYVSGTCSDYFAPGGPPACRPMAGSLADGNVCANSNQCRSALAPRPCAPPAALAAAPPPRPSV